MAITIGFRQGLALDDSRRAWRSERPRPVRWAAWYPADESADAAFDIFAAAKPSIFVSGPVALDAGLLQVEEAWPVVAISHGTGGSALGLCWLAQALAHRGFVVIGVSHHGNTLLEPFLAEGFLCWWERARDLSFILDELRAQAAFAGKADFNSAVTVGFSLGAHAALSLLGARTHMPLFGEWLAGAGRLARGPKEFPNLDQEYHRLQAESAEFRDSFDKSGDSYHDPRIKAAVLLAPAPPVRAFTPESLASIDKPVHIISGAADTEAPFADCAAWLCQQNADFQLTKLDGEAGHYVFLPEGSSFGREVAPDICIDPAGVSRTAIHAAAAEACVRLFSRPPGRA